MFKSQYGDDKPWVETTNGQEQRYASFDWDNGNRCRLPRPEFDALPVNRVLHEFRDDYRWAEDWEAYVDQWIDFTTGELNFRRIWEAVSYSQEEVDFARKVLVRLRALL